MTHPRTHRFEAVKSDLRERGFVLEETKRGVIGTGGTVPPLEGQSPLSITYPDSGAPLSIVSQIANAAQEETVPLLVVDRWTRDDVRSVLAEPFLLAGERDVGREFYSIPDRIRLTDDTYACAPTTASLQWVEDQTATVTRRTTDAPQLVLQARDDVVTALDSTESLRCPGPPPDAFPTRYERVDDRFRVYEGADIVGSFAKIRTMRAQGYRPVPLPLVPEHHVRSNGHLARSVVLAAVEDGNTTYEDPR